MNSNLHQSVLMSWSTKNMEELKQAIRFSFVLFDTTACIFWMSFLGSSRNFSMVISCLTKEGSSQISNKFQYSRQNITLAFSRLSSIKELVYLYTDYCYCSQLSQVSVLFWSLMAGWVQGLCSLGITTNFYHCFQKQKLCCTAKTDSTPDTLEQPISPQARSLSLFT